MKKIILFILGIILFTGCSIDDEGEMVSQYAKVESVNFPEYFEAGKTYELEVTYMLPTACHNALGIDVFRVGSSGDDKREIYIAGVTSYSPGNGECTRSNTDPARREKFTILIDETLPYNFYLYQRQSANDQAEYTKVTIRVGAPGEQDPD